MDAADPAGRLSQRNILLKKPGRAGPILTRGFSQSAADFASERDAEDWMDRDQGAAIVKRAAAHRLRAMTPQP